MQIRPPPPQPNKMLESNIGKRQYEHEDESAFEDHRNDDNSN